MDPRLLHDDPFPKRKTLEYWVDEAEWELRDYCRNCLPTVLPVVLRKAYEEANRRLMATDRMELQVGDFLHGVCELTSKRISANALDDHLDRPPHIPDDLPESATMPERMAQLIRIVWADVRFWRIVARRSEQDVNTAPDYLRIHYQLEIEFPPEVWKEMVGNTARRGYLFELLTCAAPRWFALQGDGPRSGGRPDELNSLLIAKVIGDYLDRPKDDHRSRLAARKWPPETLLALRSACLRLAADADWCAKNPGRYFARRAPHPAHRLPTYAKARHLEAMVKLLRKRPIMSDYELAWERFESDSSTGRELAKEARELARLRDGIKAKRHKRRGT